ncbi:MAG: type I restriction enzyme HsdR N-terminal domain-containing protein [Alistipes sp.]|nr:type I restriction enzyme HsdR N-terminal domain-containing protein [Alistipes sp.]
MPTLPKLNFPPIRLRGRRTAQGQEVWDELRQQWVVLTPEEWVRRHLVACLIEHYGCQRLQLVEEYPVQLNGQAQRADLVLLGRSGKPLLVAECKAHGVKIDQAVLDQAVRYNSVLGARYLFLTNGERHYCYEVVDGVATPCPMPLLHEQ